jgi:hypothetical protein
MRAMPKTSASQKARKHVEDLLDEALEQTFPASDPVAMIQPTPDLPSESVEEAAMPKWLVTAVWQEDEAEATEQWEVAASTADEAVQQVTPRFRIPPHHVETRRVSKE